ncbi:hypothetical protein [Streptodolium elevatio]|uniref:Uncharacterized protein n=1 Tax=Streptodolium elevatio TaxID=3157996 RepID=A0ABV3DMY0_9ACTN
MIPDGMLPHTVVKRRPTVAEDAHGNDALTYPSSGPSARAWLQQRSTTEVVGGRETVATQWWMYTNDPDWQPRDRLTWNAQSFDVDGHPKPVYSPDGLHHLEVPLRRVTG